MTAKPDPKGMLSQLDYYRSARLIIDRYGEGARLEAARCADAQLDQGNIEGAQDWLSIAHAIIDLQRTTRAKGEALH